MATRNVAAVDLGAESGRVVLARFDGQRLALEEVHRFPNRPARIQGHLFWDAPCLWNEILIGLRKAKQLAGHLDSIGVDTWGVDYGLIDQSGLLLGLPFHYRDHRTDGVMARLRAQLGDQAIYGQTGIQFLPFNTLYQLVAHQAIRPDELAHSHRLLLMPDLLHHWLSGAIAIERTNATTTQLWNDQTGTWVTEWFDMIGIAPSLLPPVVAPGTVLGTLVPNLAAELGDGVRVIAPATHDTGSAVAAIPVALPGGWGYISSGTWSLVGVELPHPLVTAEAQAANFTNEGGVFGTTRFLKNVMGLWLLQECQRSWARTGTPQDTATLIAQVGDIPTFTALFDPDHPSLLAPDDMPSAINALLASSGHPPLHEPLEFARAIMESLVVRYQQVFDQIRQLTGIALNGIHVIGGGARNGRLNQWLADVSGVPVIAGPFEATAVGNALLQLVGLGELHDGNEVRRLAQTMPTEVYSPRFAQQEHWDAAVAQFVAVTPE